MNSLPSSLQPPPTFALPSLALIIERVEVRASNRFAENSTIRSSNAMSTEPIIADVTTTTTTVLPLSRVRAILKNSPDSLQVHSDAVFAMAKAAVG